VTIRGRNGVFSEVDASQSVWRQLHNGLRPFGDASLRTQSRFLKKNAGPCPSIFLNPINWVRFLSDDQGSQENADWYIRWGAFSDLKKERRAFL
jgi:hypothetical protein